MHSKLQWDELREEMRRAAVAIHFARIAFLAAPEHCRERSFKALIDARLLYQDAAQAFQDAVGQGLDTSVTEAEIIADLATVMPAVLASEADKGVDEEVVLADDAEGLDDDAAGELGDLGDDPADVAPIE